MCFCLSHTHRMLFWLPKPNQMTNLAKIWYMVFKYPGKHNLPQWVWFSHSYTQKKLLCYQKQIKGPTWMNKEFYQFYAHANNLYSAIDWSLDAHSAFTINPIYTELQHMYMHTYRYHTHTLMHTQYLWKRKNKTLINKKKS